MGARISQRKGALYGGHVPDTPWTMDAFSVRIGNESVPKIIINNAINLFFFKLQSAFLQSNHNSFRVLFDKIASVYFI